MSSLISEEKRVKNLQRKMTTYYLETISLCVLKGRL